MKGLFIIICAAMLLLTVSCGQKHKAKGLVEDFIEASALDLDVKTLLG